VSRAATAERLRRAVARREALRQRPDLSAYRLVNRAGDDLPGLAVDRFADALVVHVDAAPDARLLADLRAGLTDVSPSAYLKLHPPHASRTRDESTQHAWGPSIESVVVRENGLAYRVRPAGGLTPGLFLDMREVRAWVLEHAAGREVLNLFAYTCAFGVCAARGGARRVLNLDLSRSYLTWGQDNYALNNLPVDATDFVYGDALDWLARFARRRQTFELVIVDPPSFSTSKQGTFAAERDYTRLAAAAARVVAPGGILLAATNHAGLSASRFDAGLARGITEAGRRARLLHRWHEPELDFPLAPGHHPYLKVRALILDETCLSSAR
jgi:23S rRNA (cytosine1962-C5)-methyltransferase